MGKTDLPKSIERKFVGPNKILMIIMYVEN